MSARSASSGAGRIYEDVADEEDGEPEEELDRELEKDETCSTGDDKSGVTRDREREAKRGGSEKEGLRHLAG